MGGGSPLVCPLGALLFLLLQIMTFHMHSSLANNKTNTSYIETSCNFTSYPRLCYHYLSPYASKIRTSPKRLASTSLIVTLRAANSTWNLTKELEKTRRRDLTPRKASALKDCVEEVGESVDELKESLKEMGHMNSSNFGIKLNNIQTWVSAALTDDDTCLDGFSEDAVANGGDDDVETAVRRSVMKTAHLTSITLAFIDKFASAHVTSY